MNSSTLHLRIVSASAFLLSMAVFALHAADEPVRRAPSFHAPAEPIETLLGAPIWSGDTVTNEPVLFIQPADAGTDGRPGASLLFHPTEIISVRSSTLKITYTQGSDYTIEPGTGRLTLPAGSRISHRKEADFYLPPKSPNSISLAVGDKAKKFLPDAWLLYGDNEPRAYTLAQVVVTYRHQPGEWKGYRPAYGGEALSRTVALLKAREPLKILVLGDSISSGANATATRGLAPYLPPWPWLVTDALKRAYGAPVEYVNASKGGKTADFAPGMVDAVVAEKPDLVILAFGMNDGSAGKSADIFADNISTTMTGIRKQLPKTEFILVATLVGNPEWRYSAPTLYPLYRDKLKAMCGPGVALTDMTTLWTDVLAKKTYWDLTGNGINHPNDFGHRLYTHTILGLLIKDVR